MNKNIIFITVCIGIFFVLGGGYVMSQKMTKIEEEKNLVMKKDATMQEEASESDKNEQREMEEKKAMEKSGSSNTKANGAVLAGKTTPYMVFDNASFEQAKKDGKIIFLEFYANWCPICRSQEPKLFEGFTSLDMHNVVGFRVNYNDSDTDEIEKNLAKEFGVTYQHTHVIVKDGKVVSKNNDELDSDSLKALIEGVK